MWIDRKRPARELEAALLRLVNWSIGVTVLDIECLQRRAYLPGIRVLRVLFEGLCQQLIRDIEITSREKQWSSLQKQIICVQITRRRHDLDRLQLANAQRVTKCVDNGVRNLVLYLKDVLGRQRTIVVIRPEMPVVVRIDQLRSNPNGLTRLAHAAFDDVAHLQRRRDLGYADVLALELKRRGT